MKRKPTSFIWDVYKRNLVPVRCERQVANRSESCIRRERHEHQLFFGERESRCANVRIGPMMSGLPEYCILNDKANNYNAYSRLLLLWFSCDLRRHAGSRAIAAWAPRRRAARRTRRVRSPAALVSWARWPPPPAAAQSLADPTAARPDDVRDTRADPDAWRRTRRAQRRQLQEPRSGCRAAATHLPAAEHRPPGHSSRFRCTSRYLSVEQISGRELRVYARKRQFTTREPTGLWW